ncbi:phage tail protein [Alteriqipengyuania lutimaris]|nr:hypothetical protein [Alteriqipengyuania lutimaris]MBB3035371.1 hypothetical protein [Alteriqipengyuania lutimaris]
MPGVAKFVGQVAGVVAGVASIIPGGQGIAAIAGGISLAASAIGGLSAQPPRSEGQVQERILGANNPLPLAIGRSYSGGVQVHDVGFGNELDDVKNPYRFIAAVHSACGPVKSLTPVADYHALAFGAGSPAEETGFYEEHMWRDAQLGAQPEANALQSQFGTPPRWSSAHKLSGKAAVAYTLLLKKGGKFPGSTVPALAEIIEGTSAYDARLDSTYPGGSGAQRIGQESTYAYTRNPGCHGLTYAYGRFENGERIMGVNLGITAIDVASFVAFANLCDANGWTVNGIVYEPGDKWNNLKLILEAGGGVPVISGGILRVDFHAPRPVLHRIVREDLASDDISGRLGKGWKRRHNTLVPRYRSEPHQWSYQQAGAVSKAEWVTEDGEVKSDERQWDLVTDLDQVTQLAGYDLWQRREDGPFVVLVKPHLRWLKPGDAVEIDEELGLHPDGTIKAVIRRRAPDLETGGWRFVLEAETDAKHSEVLALTGSVSDPVELPTIDELADVANANSVPAGLLTQLIANSYITDADPADGLLQATDGQIDVENHTRTYTDLASPVAVTGGALTVEDDGSTAIAAATTYHIYYDDPARAGGAVALKATRIPSTAATSGTNPVRHRVGTIKTDVAGGGGTQSGGSVPPGWSPDDYNTP